MDSRLEQAKEWAWGVTSERIPDTSSGRTKLAAAKVIQSLPDTIVDGEKLREVINKVLASTLYGTVGRQVAEDYAALIGELIPAPPLPTLAELIEQGNDPQQYQWMQCTVEGSDDTFVIVMVREHVSKVLLPDGIHEVKGNSQVTPLPDLPKLEWPGDDDDHESEYCPVCGATLLDDGSECEHCREDADLLRPEDVLAGEPWLVRYEEQELVAYKADLGDLPWVVHLNDKGDYLLLSDAEITLISRLVPEYKENA